MEITLYAHYGQLTHEHEPVYHEREIQDALLAEPGRWIIPDEYPLATNTIGQVLIDLPGEGTCMLQDVLRTDRATKRPELYWHDGQRRYRVILEPAQ